MNRYINTKSNKGFTIIELLIVIVIIAILVAITAVSYNGITKSAKEATLQSDLKQTSKAIELERAKTGGVYPSSSTISSLITTSSNNNLQLVYRFDYEYCIKATIGSDSNYYVMADGVPRQGYCPPI